MALNPETLVIETFVPAPEDDASMAAINCTGCPSGCGIDNP
jgi:hypothetical protein